MKSWCRYRIDYNVYVGRKYYILLLYLLYDFPWRKEGYHYFQYNNVTFTYILAKNNPIFDFTINYVCCQIFSWSCQFYITLHFSLGFSRIYVTFLEFIFRDSWNLCSFMEDKNSNWYHLKSNWTWFLNVVIKFQDEEFFFD